MTITPSTAYTAQFAPLPMPRYLHASMPSLNPVPLQYHVSRAEAEIQHAIQSDKKKLTTVYTPLCVALGFLIQYVAPAFNPNLKISQHFSRLMHANMQVRNEVDDLVGRYLRETGDIPAHLRLPLSQLQSAMRENLTPSQVAVYLDNLHKANTFRPDSRLNPLGQMVEEYRTAQNVILKDKRGLQALASEPWILRVPLDGMGKEAAKDLARREPEAFCAALFKKSLTPENLTTFLRVFQKLETAQNMLIQLAAVGIPGLMFGYFKIAQTMKAKKHYERGL
jgi:hypothetical protein